MQASSSTLGRRGPLGQAPRALVLATAAALAACGEPDRSTRIVRDPELRSAPVTLYPAVDSTRPPRAVIVFFGNDIGFWRPHRQLASSLANAQYGVAGLDIRVLLSSLPEAKGARDSAFAVHAERLVERTRHELRGDSVPVIIAGHSLGAELAIWTAAHACLPGVTGVLALAPGTRSHLRVSMSDIMNGPEPTGPESFSVADAISMVPAEQRIAIVRGTRDEYARADSSLLAAGGTRAMRFLVPFAGHSLKRLATAGLETRRALNWLLDDRSSRR